eukprot:5651726-Amphidinium_carterae.1
MAPKAGRKPPGERPPQNSVKPLFISAAQRAAATMVLYGFVYGTAALAALHVVSPGAFRLSGDQFYSQLLKLTALGGSTTFVAFAPAACIFPTYSLECQRTLQKTLESLPRPERYPNTVRDK